MTPYDQAKTKIAQALASGNMKAAHEAVLEAIAATDDQYALDGLKSARERIEPHLPKPRITLRYLWNTYGLGVGK